jgi:hypothetical protein
MLAKATILLTVYGYYLSLFSDILHLLLSQP